MNAYAPDYLQAMEEIFQRLLRTEIESKFGLKVRRADDRFDTRDIMQSIWDSILTARFIAADSIDCNPNVLYEVGMADPLGERAVPTASVCGVRLAEVAVGARGTMRALVKLRFGQRVGI